MAIKCFIFQIFDIKDDDPVLVIISEYYEFGHKEEETTPYGQIVSRHCSGGEEERGGGGSNQPPPPPPGPGNITLLSGELTASRPTLSTVVTAGQLFIPEEVGGDLRELWSEKQLEYL